MAAAAIMFQGTGSDVGKSLIVAGLARAFTRRQLRVRPFKPQNMSNNAAVTADGGEIGRAQALQARACGVAPSVHMNPVLLKPQTDVGAQVVVQGRMQGTAKAAEYHALKPRLMPKVLESYERLGGEADLILVEGAGSPAEINLREGDIANMGFARAANVPVALIGDIDRGGVIASLVGTVALLEAEERALLKGFLVNKFRGDLQLFADGRKSIAEHTGLSDLGVVAWFADAVRLPAEDAMALSSPHNCRPHERGDENRHIKIAVPQLSRIANFDDLDPLRAEPDVILEIVPPGRPLPGDADLVILPGSKSTIGDLAFLRDQGWDIDLRAHHRRGGHVLGLCGGYQMLGHSLTDAQGIEGPAGRVDGLGLLELDTEMTGDKTLAEVAGRHAASGLPVRGYEMHIGRSIGPALARPFLSLRNGTGDRPEGAVSADGRVAGCYLHGLFAADEFRHAYLSTIRTRAATGVFYESEVERTLDALADHLAAHVDLDRILEIAHGKR
ncbi:MAG TPA: cobyric acid synthase [Dongiaceae bacterium]|jgi:adenosylcobyric acid synthase